ncbi:MAG TPA: response regulator transcription factor [Actinomycetota bacterium]|nr:response regulator transcription factor [Actinomycetota bacterium]
MSDPIRIVIVDDHRIVREGLRSMLDGVRELEIVGEAEDLDRALVVIAQTRPDVVLLDLRLQRSSGLDACRTITERHPGVHVVFLTVYEDEQYIFEALRAGARGYMLKKATPEDIVRILQAVMAGEVVVDPALGGRIALRAAALRAGRSWPGAELGLTQREGEVLAHLVRGLDNREIGQALFISEDTVKTHVKAILRKLGARDRAQAVAIALRGGLVG